MVLLSGFRFPTMIVADSPGANYPGPVSSVIGEVEGRHAMRETAQLAGFVAAHAILAVSSGKTLTMPLLVVEKEDGSTQFIELTGKSSADAVAQGERLLKKPAAEPAVRSWLSRRS
jgi:hypothetical protein